MIRIKRIFLFNKTVLIIILFFPHLALAQENISNCYSCHIKVTPAIVKAWENSPHSHRVECHECHKGNPLKEDKEEAHKSIKIFSVEGRVALCGSCHSEQKKIYTGSFHYRSLFKSIKENNSLFGDGIFLDKIIKGEQPRTGPECTTCHGAHNILAVSNPEAPTYLRKVSELCGLACHQSNYSQFIQSNHYQVLKEEHEAPTCITCHTGHADHIVPIDRLTNVCARCHSSITGISPWAPQQMQDILTLTSLGQELFSNAQKKVDLLKKQGWDTSRAEVWLNEVSQKFKQIPFHWHRFNQQVLYNDLQWTLDKLGAVEKELNNVRLIWWIVLAIALVWAFISLLAWIAYARSRKPRILLLAVGFFLLFISMFLHAELLRNIFQVMAAAIIALGVILPEIFIFSQSKKFPPRGSK